MKLIRAAVHAAGVAAVSAAVVAMAPALAGSAAAVEPTGGISGHVTTSSGDPAAGYTAVVYDDQGVEVSNADVDDEGDYLISDLAGGSYRVRFLPDHFPTFDLPEFWNNARSLETSTPILVGSSIVTGIDGQFDLAGRLSGTVKAIGGGELPADAQTFGVSAFDSNGTEWPSENSFAGSDTQYELRGLPPGDYIIKFYARTADKVMTGWSGNSLTRAGASTVHVVAGPNTANGQVAFAGSISGVIKGPGGQAMPTGTLGLVTAFDLNGNPAGSERFVEDGAFLIEGLDTGSYKLRFTTTNDVYEPQWLGGFASAAESASVSVTRGSETTNVNDSFGSSAPTGGGSGNTGGDSGGAAPTSPAGGSSGSAAGSSGVAAPNGGGAAASSSPIAVARPQIVGAIAHQLGAHKSVNLPKRASNGARLRWKTKTPTICKIKHGKLITAKRGLCKLKVNAAASGSRDGFVPQIYKIKIHR